MYNSKSIDDGVQFISQSNMRTSKTSNKLKNNKYKNENNKKFILDNDEEIIENFTINDNNLVLKNELESKAMSNNIVGYNSSIYDLNGVQNNITKQAKIFLDINKKSDDSSLRNKDVQITDGKFARVNNAGLFKLYPSGATKCGVPVVPKSVAFELLGKSPNDYSVLEDSAGNLALYGTDMEAGPNGSYACSEYSGQNIYVANPVSFNYDTNMVYVGVYNQESANQASAAGQLQPDLANSTVKQCVTRAMDEGKYFASLSNYDSSTKTGQCYIGNNILAPSSNAYKTIPRETIFTFSNPSHDAFTFAADGGLYSGTSGSGGNPFITPLISATGGTKVPVAALSPKYGGTISYITASYDAFRWGNWYKWDNLVRFNDSLLGTIGGSLDTFKKYKYYTRVLKTYSYQKNGRTYSYQQWDWEIQTQDAQVTWTSTGPVYINYKCGNEGIEPIYKEVSLGAGFNIGCSELYNKYPSFSMMLSDDGLITIVNNANYDEILYTKSYQISDLPITQPVSIAGANKTMMPWADRPDWVSGSVNRGDLLTSYSLGSQTLTNGQYISSPSGKCRLIFYKSGSTPGRLVLEYSVYNVALTQDATTQGIDKDNNLIGNANNYAQYYLTKVDNPNVKGKTAYIDINNGLHEYPNDMTQYDNKYIQMENFAPYSENGTTVPNVREDGCIIACNNDAACAGYTYNDSICKKYRDTEIYPKGIRIYEENKNMNIRRKKISSTNSSHYSCNKVVSNVDSSIYSSYPTSSAMTTSQKCALGLILEPRMGILETKNTAAVTKGNEIKGFINNIYTNQTKLKDTINKKSIDVEEGIAKQENIKKKIDKYEESNITNTATVSDTEMLLISDNYKYVIWSIVTVIAGVAAIKTFRSTSI